MHSVVTPISVVRQYFEADAEPILLDPGARLVVLGAANGDLGFLWMEVDHADHPWMNANVVLSPSNIRYLCEVGEDLHMKASH